MRIRRVVLAAAAVLVAGCSLLPPPAGIQLTIPAGADVRELPVTVVDRAGIVLEAVPVAVPAGALDEAGVHVVGDADGDEVVVLAWLGGACDDRAIVTFDPMGERYRVGVETRISAMSCSAVGVPRAVALTLAELVAPDDFEAVEAP